MHSKIITVSTEPIEPFETVLDDSTLSENGFYPWICDYYGNVDESSAKAVVRSWTEMLSEQYEDLIETDNESYVIFKKGFKTAYTKDLIDKIRKYVLEKVPSSLADYSHPSIMTYGLMRIIEDQFGLYIFAGPMYTEDRFFKELNEETTYRFGNVIDYHY